MIYNRLPTPGDDATANFRVGDRWFIPSTQALYVAENVSPGNAVWRHESASPVVVVGSVVDALPVADLLTRVITTATGTAIFDVEHWSTIALQLTGNAAGFNVTFEASLDGTNWAALIGTRASDGLSSSVATGWTNAQVWRFNVSGLRFFRVRATALTSGTATILGGRSTEVADVTAFAGTQAVSVNNTPTVNANVQSTPAINADTTTNLAASASFTGTSRDAGATNQFRTFSATVSSPTAGTFRIESSIDGTIWYPTSQVTITAGEARSLEVPVCARYHRVVFVNSATAQTGASFCIRSAYHRL